MDSFKKFNLLPDKGICYSGFRAGQHPGVEYPTYEQVREDLLILQANWKYLRLYDCDQHAQAVLEIIEKENLDFKVMLGAYINAEMNNFACPWNGGVFAEDILKKNKKDNENKIQKLIEMTNRYKDIVFSVSAGNEACVNWTDHYVPPHRVINFVNTIQKNTDKPVTFCENYAAWLNNLDTLAQKVDFISIHTYPVWEYKSIHEALEYTKQNYFSVAQKYPDKTVVITEAGWATNSNGRGIDPQNVSEENQKIYYEDLMQWTEKERILTFVFEAFDETWKGSQELLEPEKHWGLFYENRKPKKVTSNIYKTN